MKAAVRLAALVVALGNGYLLLGATPERVAFYPPLELLQGVGVAVFSGLLAAEVALRMARTSLAGPFFHRYAALVITVSLGGSLYGALLALGGIVHDTLLGVGGLLGYSLVASLWGFTWGGVLGLLEGVLLGLPLAWLLGRGGGSPEAQRLERHDVRAG